MAAAAILKNSHILAAVSAISTKFGWVTALMAVYHVTNLKFTEIRDGGGRHPIKIKITISRQRFDQSAQHLA